MIQYNYYTKNSTWAQAKDLSISSPGTTAVNPQVAIDSLNNAIAVWTLSNSGVGKIQYSYYTQNSSWSTAADLSTSNASNPQISIDSLDSAIAVWSRYDGKHFIVQSSYYNKDGSWSVVKNLSAIDGNAFTPQIAIDNSIDNSIYVRDVTLNTNLISMNTRTSQKLEAYIDPTNATYTEVVWTSNNTSNCYCR